MSTFAVGIVLVAAFIWWELHSDHPMYLQDVLTQATVHSGYLLVGVVLGLLGAGMGTAMSPATESIMGSLPLAKAGVGSAVNDTTRQVGGALGVAVLGSITNSVYRSHVGSSAVLSALPAAARSAVRNGIGNALAVADRMGATPAAARLASDAKVAFVHAVTSTVYNAAAFALAGAVFAMLWLPARPAAPAAWVGAADGFGAAEGIGAAEGASDEILPVAS